jgi:hypothetical protein
MAANARRAWDCGEGYRLPTLFFAACFVGFALLSMSGLHSAWAFVKAHASGAPLPDDALMRALFTFVTFSELAMNYGVEALKVMHNNRAPLGAPREGKGAPQRNSPACPAAEAAGRQRRRGDARL